MLVLPTPDSETGHKYSRLPPFLGGGRRVKIESRGAWMGGYILFGLIKDIKDIRGIGKCVIIYQNFDGFIVRRSLSLFDVATSSLFYSFYFRYFVYSYRIVIVKFNFLCPLL